MLPSRRSVLLAPAIAALAGAAACSSKDGGGEGAASPTSSVPSAQPSATSSIAAVDGVVSWTTGFWYDELKVEIGPAIRGASNTVLPVRVTKTDGGKLSLTTSPLGVEPFESTTMLGARLIDAAAGMVYPELDTSSPKQYGEELTMSPVFAPLPESATEIAVLINNLGVAPRVPVVAEGDPLAKGVTVDSVVSAATMDTSLAGPYQLGWLTAAADGSSDTTTTDTTVTVTIAGDVTFESDSAALSAQADSVLATAVSQLAQYPSGGSLTIVGHTDDVADDAHNQALSEQRAQAVSDRLAQLTDMKPWRVSVSGKGEKEPRVNDTTDEARAANRRVELTATPAKPDEASASTASATPSASAAASSALPTPAGPAGTGADGVDVADTGEKDTTLHLSLDQVIRSGGFLFGNVKVTYSETSPGATGGFVAPSEQRFGVPYPALARWTSEWSNAGVVGMTLLAGTTRLYPVDFDGNGDGKPAMVTGLTSTAKFGATMTMPVVWADAGQDTVTLDIPGGKYHGNPLLAARLTDIPVMAA